MTLTEIRLRLQELGVRPSRRLGQNFLHDQNLARRIVDLAEVRDGDDALEIGPGLGALTQDLIERGANLTLLEKEARFIPFLRARFPGVRIIEGDALEEMTRFESQISNGIVTGNLPYSIASPLIVRLCEPGLRPRKMLFTVQLEVAERLAARARTHDFGLLTLLTQAFYEIKMVRKVPPTVFWPRPEVGSAVVAMVRRESQPFSSLEQDRAFRELGKAAFQKRRKSLGAIFGERLPEGMDRARRPEELGIDEWVSFALARSTEEEFFDVVNERDEVTSRQRRSEVHRKALWHRAVHILIWNSQGELLLQKRSPSKDVAPNTWDSSAAGHLGAGEDYDAAARREMGEELGVQVPLHRAQRFAACQELGWEFVWLYEGKSEGPFRFPASEISELRWWTIEDLDCALRERPSEFAPSFRHLWFHGPRFSRAD